MTALFGFCRAFHLFANGHAKPFADQRQQISFGCVDRDAAHRDVLAIVPASLRQGDIQCFCCGNCIVKEHLVKITHAVEQQCVVISGLKVEILRHHWCDLIVAHVHPPLAYVSVQNHAP